MRRAPNALDSRDLDYPAFRPIVSHAPPPVLYRGETLPYVPRP